MKKLKIGIVGLNRGAGVGAILQEQSHAVEVTAICDCNPEVLERCRKQFGGVDAGQKTATLDTASAFQGGTYLSYEEMLAKADIEAVYVATPIPSHADHVVMALQAGRHVISEVPCANTLEDCARIQAAVKASGRKYMLAEQYCYLRTWSIALAMVRAGLFGEVYYAEGNYLMDFTGRPGYPYIGGWRQNIYHMHRGHVYITHSLGPLTMLFPEPLKKVSCVGCGQYPRHWGLKADNTCTVALKTASGKMIHLREDFLSPRPHDFLYYAFQGTKGAFEGSHGYHGVFNKEIVPMDQRVYIPGLCKNDEWRDLEDFAAEFQPEYWKNMPKKFFDNSYNGGEVWLFDLFAEAIRNNTQTPIPAEVALNWTAAGILSESSAEADGEPVEIPEYRG